MTCIVLPNIAGPCKACGEPLGEDVHCVSDGRPGHYTLFHGTCCPCSEHDTTRKRKKAQA